jgi:tungstate transport system permease protein
MSALAIAARSVEISGLATFLACAWCLPISLRLSTSSKGKGLRVLFLSFTSVPTVVIGLLLYLLLSSSGPLGSLSLLYTPAAVVIGQAVLITPLMISLTMEAISRVSPAITDLALTLGGSRRHLMGLLRREASPSILSAVLLAFCRAVGELGVALMLGGNIPGWTRVMSTAIALELERGEVELCLQLTGLLLAIVLPLVFVAHKLGEGRRWTA